MTEAERAAVVAFFALLDAADLNRLDESVFNYNNAQNWWFRDEITAEQKRRKGQ